MGMELKADHHLRKVSKPYPHIMLEGTIDDALPVILGAVGKGDLPILVVRGGNTIVLPISVKRTMVDMHKIISIYAMTVHIDESTSFKAKSIEDLIEGEFPWTDC